MTQANDGEFTVERHAQHAPGWVGRLPAVRAAAGFCLYLVSYYFAYLYGMSFSHVTASPFWFPDSVLLCALLLTPTRWWWAFLLGYKSTVNDSAPGDLRMDAFMGHARVRVAPAPRRLATAEGREVGRPCGDRVSV